MPMSKQTSPCQELTSSGFSKCCGITGPICNDFPEEDELIQTRRLIDTMKCYDVYENHLELQHRELVLKRLESLFKEWLQEKCEEMNIPEVVKDKIRGKIFPFGSYRLGAYSKGANINALCVGPVLLERKDFFTSLFDRLRVQKEVKNIHVIYAIEEAFVPVIQLSFDGIDIDLVFACIQERTVPENLDTLDNNTVKNIDEHCIRSLNCYTVTEEIIRLVPNIYTFRDTLRAIKLWANRRNIYSNTLGFLGGISWAIMVAKICQGYPYATSSTVVAKFFKIYSTWKWPTPVHLKDVENYDSSPHFWDPAFPTEGKFRLASKLAGYGKVNLRDRCHLMPIITPAYPCQNTSVKVSHSTLIIIKKEIQRGLAIVEEIQQNKAQWSKLLESPDFFEKYKHYIELKASCARESRRWQRWIILVELKIRLLVRTLEENEHICLVHVNTACTLTDDKDGLSTMWLIGLVFNTKTPDEKSNSCNMKECIFSSLKSFTENIYRMAKSCRVYEKGMTILATYKEHRKLKQNPGASRPSCGTPPPSRMPPFSTRNQDTEREDMPPLSLPYEIFKADKPTASVTNVPFVQAAFTPGRRAAHSVIPQATTRPRSPCSEASAEEFKAAEEPAQESKTTCSGKPSPSVSTTSPPGGRASGTKKPLSPELETPAKKSRYDLVVPESPPPPIKNVSVRCNIKLILSKHKWLTRR